MTGAHIHTANRSEFRLRSRIRTPGLSVIYKLASAVIMVVAIVIMNPTSALAVRPSFTALNNGGAGQVPLNGTSRCEYSAAGQICKIAVTNTSAFEVTIINSLVIETEATTRYKEANDHCGVNTTLAANNGVCTLEIKRETGQGACPQMNSYAIEVEETGSKGMNTESGGVELKME